MFNLLLLLFINATVYGKSHYPIHINGHRKHRSSMRGSNNEEDTYGSQGVFELDYTSLPEDILSEIPGIADAGIADVRDKVNDKEEEEEEEEEEEGEDRSRRGVAGRGPKAGRDKFEAGTADVSDPVNAGTTGAHDKAKAGRDQANAGIADVRDPVNAGIEYPIENLSNKVGHHRKEGHAKKPQPDTVNKEEEATTTEINSDTLAPTPEPIMPGQDGHGLPPITPKDSEDDVETLVSEDDIETFVSNTLGPKPRGKDSETRTPTYEPREAGPKHVNGENGSVVHVKVLKQATINPDGCRLASVKEATEHLIKFEPEMDQVGKWSIATLSDGKISGSGYGWEIKPYEGSESEKQQQEREFRKLGHKALICSPSKADNADN